MRTRYTVRTLAALVLSAGAAPAQTPTAADVLARKPVLPHPCRGRAGRLPGRAGERAEVG